MSSSVRLCSGLVLLSLPTVEAGWYYNEGEAAKVGIIVGTLVACLAVVLFFVLFIYCCLWKRRGVYDGPERQYKRQRLPEDFGPRPFLPDPSTVAHPAQYEMRKPPVTQFAGGDSPAELRETVRPPVTLATSTHSGKVSKQKKAEKRDASAQTRPRHSKNVQTGGSLSNAPVGLKASGQSAVVTEGSKKAEKSKKSHHHEHSKAEQT